MRIAEIHLLLNYNYELRCDLDYQALQGMVSFQPILICLHQLLADFGEPMNGDAASWQSG